ncbi:MAG: hypothetical protein AB1591_03550 [Pseudomonadota bacterium]
MKRNGSSGKAEKIKQPEVHNGKNYHDNGDGAVLAFLENFLKAHLFAPAWVVSILRNSSVGFLDADQAREAAA